MPKRQPGLISRIAEAVYVAQLIPVACPSIVGGRYELQEAIGLGNRACTYRARDLTLCDGEHNAEVILKVYRPGVSEEQEALFARRIEHPSVARILDRGEIEGGQRFCVIEYLQGGSLAELKQLPPLRTAVTWARDLARGVQAAHDKGVIHCDIKPDNVLLTAQRVPKLADFDLACDFSHPGLERRGTITYLAPELYRAEAGGITPAVDVYGLGAVLHYLLTGRPANGETPQEAEQFLESDRPHEVACAPRTLRRIIERALARQRAHRYRAAGEFADDLERWLTHRPVDWQRPSIGEISGLWSRRQPGAAVALCSILFVGVGGVIGSYEWNRREQARVIAMQAEANRIAEIQIEELRGRARRIIEGVSSSLAASGPSEEFLPAVAWTHWLGTESLIAKDGEFIAGDQHIAVLEGYLNEAELLEGPDGLYGTVVRFALGHAHLKNEDPAAAQECFERVLAKWNSERPETDLLLTRCRALLACSMAEQAPLQDRARWIAQLDEIIQNAEVGMLGTRVTTDLVRTRDSLAQVANR